MPIPFRRLLWPKSLAGKAGVVGLWMLIVLATTYLSALWMTSTRLAEAMKLGSELGFSNDVQELLGPRVADEENAATPLDESCAVVKQFMGSVRRKLNLQAMADPFDNAEFIAEMDALKDDSAFERLLDEADRRPAYRSPTVFSEPLFNTLLDHIQDRRYLCRAERAISHRLQLTGRHEEAGRRLLRLLRITRRWEDKEPFVISLLVNIAIRGVAFAQMNSVLRNGSGLSKELHDEIDREFMKHEQLNHVLPFIGQWENVSIPSYLEDLSSKQLLFIRPLRDHRHAELLEDTHTIMQLWNAPYYDSKAALDAIETREQAMARSPLGTLLKLPANNGFRGTYNAVFRVVARARCLRVVNAWSRRRDFNANLDQLGLPNEVLTDPFNGQPLRVKRTPDGPIIYSVGDDLRDNNGDINRSPGDQGYGPRPIILVKQ